MRGAPRIVGELQKIRTEVAKSTRVRDAPYEDLRTGHLGLRAALQRHDQAWRVHLNQAASLSKEWGPLLSIMPPCVLGGLSVLGGLVFAALRSGFCGDP